MKETRTTLLLFCIPILIVALAVDFMSRAIPNDYTYKNGIIQHQGFTFTTLVLGSSHSYYGINPDYFSTPGCNGAHPSQTLEFDAFVLKKWQPALPHLKTVILPLTYPSLSSILQKDDETWRIKNYVLYYGYRNTLNPRFYSELFTSKPVSTLHEYLDYRIKGTTRIGCSTNGFGLGFATSSPQGLSKSGLAAAQRHHAQGDLFHEKNKRALTEIIAFCKTHNLQLILLTLPASRSYRQALSSKQLTMLHTVRDSLAQTHNKVSSVNLLDDQRFKKDDFYDGDHLNHQGAKKLSLILDSIMTQQE